MGAKPTSLFDNEARHILSLAASEAGRLRHTQVQGEHLLLGILHSNDLPLIAILNTSGVSLERARDIVEQYQGVGVFRQGPDQMGLSGQQAVDQAVAIAAAYGRTQVGPAHLLFGVLSVESHVLRAILGVGNMEPTQLRDRLIELI